VVRSQEMEMRSFDDGRNLSMPSEAVGISTA